MRVHIFCNKETLFDDDDMKSPVPDAHSPGRLTVIGKNNDFDREGF